MDIKTDVVIVGTGVAGLFAAWHLSPEKQIIMITKADLESCNSFLAQGGICVLRDEEDYESFFEDTMKAGHYENREESVDIMIRSSREVIHELVDIGVDFARKDGAFLYTKEGAHSRPRILFHEDITGKEITSKLLAKVKALPNVTIYEYTTMVDILTEIDEEKNSSLKNEIPETAEHEQEQEICQGNKICRGVVAENAKGEEIRIFAEDTIWATGGIGGCYQNSTNFSHLTGDALRISKMHGIRLEHLDYVQIHPTTLYSEKPGRRFLISESVRGEGAVLYNKAGERFVDELLPRDVVSKAIQKQMEKDQMKHVWLSMEYIEKETILQHFPNIYDRCLAEGYDVTKEWIPVVPAQHYFMGGVWVDSDSRTSMEHLYAAGETSCNGVHGANRLASNSLLESLVFARRAAQKILKGEQI